MYAFNILNFDPRPDPPVVKEIKEQIPNEIRVQVRPQQAQYRFNCMDGMDHPMCIETENYTLVTVARSQIDTLVQSEACNRYPTFSQAELEFIASVRRRPEVEWAIDNSFDGVYIAKEEDYSTYQTHFKFAVYMKTEQATFWKLKFSGQ